jgi:hypothetical protein
MTSNPVLMTLLGAALGWSLLSGGEGNTPKDD